VRSDRRRHNFLQDDGWVMFYATDIDVYRDSAALMRKIDAAIERRSAVPLIQAAGGALEAAVRSSRATISP
jgi:hypothetical protein